MSHDRGCYKCWKEKWAYRSCTEEDCPKRSLVKEWDRIKRKKKELEKDKNNNE